MASRTESFICPPQLNADVGGIGVRISFYLQALFLAWLSARSASFKEKRSSLYALIATNIAMVVTTTILSFKPKPEVTLQDVITVLYLLGLSWTAVVFSMPSNSSSRSTETQLSESTLRYVSIAHSYAICAFAFVMLVKADDTFGSQPACNRLAKVIVFRPFNILPFGRILALVTLGFVTFLYTLMTSIDYSPIRFDSKRGNTVADCVTVVIENEKRFDAGIDGPMIVEIIIVTVLWSIAVINTELLIKGDNFLPSEEPRWQFGQILTLFLVVIPFGNMIKAFRLYGLRKQPPKESMDEQSAPAEHPPVLDGHIV